MTDFLDAIIATAFVATITVAFAFTLAFTP